MTIATNISPKQLAIEDSHRPVSCGQELKKLVHLREEKASRYWRSLSPFLPWGPFYSAQISPWLLCLTLELSPAQSCWRHHPLCSLNTSCCLANNTKCSVFPLVHELSNDRSIAGILQTVENWRVSDQIE